ncbi:MAG: SNF2-related protein [Myxococcota bacterium]|nr:SNF2-related protein [Myxococcota bacterium]
MTKDRALAVLRRLGLDWACEPGLLPWPLPPVVPLSRKSNRDWWVGDESMVSYQGDDEGFPLKGVWSSDRNARHGGQCAEVAVAILVHCWNMPQYKPMFDLPEWELELHDVVAGRQSQQEMFPLGRIRYRLTDAPTNRPDALPLERELIRWSRSDGRAMRPRLMTDDGAEIRLDRACINNEDSAIHDLVSLLRQWNRSTVQSAGPKVADFRQRVIARVFDHLLDVDDLWYGEARLRPIRTPFLPTLTAIEEGDEIALSWDPLIIKLYPFGNGFAVCADGTIRPLADSRLLEVSNRLIEGLPRLSVDDVELFVDRVVLASALPCVMDGPRLPEVRDADRITGRIRLYEDESFLCLDLAYVYRLDGEEYEVAAATLNSQHRAKRGIFRRDPHREANLRAEARATLGVALPARIEGDAAYRILLDGLPRLPEGWNVDADRDLLRFKVSGRLATKVSVPSDTDWLDLKVEFSHDGQVIDSLDVLKSWRKGERFHRLDDGTLVHLPMEWLQRHGVVHEELEAIRATNEGRIPHYAAPMLADLIGEADGDVSIWEERMAELEEASSVPDRAQPKGLKAELREYQQAGFRWLAWLKDRSFGGVLADDMGLGKTVQALALLLDEHQAVKGGQSLVVAPTSVIYAWEEEAARFTPDLKVVVYHGSNRPKEPPEDADLIVTSYGLLRYAADAFKRSWRCLVLDEAQRIKNPESHVAKVARGLTAHFRLALTGTPLENRLLELWSILECLMPGFFGPRTAFRRRYSIPIERNRDEDALSRLQRRIRPFILRRLKSEVAQELPPRQEQVLYCELGPEQRRLYERVRNTYRQSVLKKVNETGVGRSTLPVLEALMRLRQACCDPGLLPFPEAEEVKESAKLDLLVNTLDKTIPAGHRTLVFSQWTSLLQRVIPRLEKNNWAYLYLDGRTTKRHELVKKWNDPEGPPVFLISLRAGGAGLNLTGADHVIHLDPWWNPAVEDQATDRAHRIGQTKPVVAYRFVARDTVEEKVIALQDRKRALFDMTVEQGRFPVDQLTREDIESFFDGDARPDDLKDGKMASVTIDVESVSKDQASSILLDHGQPLTPTIVVELTGWPKEEADAWLDDQVTMGNLEAVNHDDGRHFVRAE